MEAVAAEPAHLIHAAEIAAKAPILAVPIANVSSDPETLRLLNELHEQIRLSTTYLRPSAQRTVRFALEVALLAHHGQRRRSGEPFVSHPVAVACILGGSNMEKATVIAGLLHDTVEDTALSFGGTLALRALECLILRLSCWRRALSNRPRVCSLSLVDTDVETMFGYTVRRIVEGETKVSKLPKMVRQQMSDEGLTLLDGEPSKVEEQVENLRSMFIAMADDWRIVVVKLADRLHNMRTLQWMPVEKRASIARETLEIFAPLAHRLGMWQFKTELSDLSFKYLFPAEYEQLDSRINSKFEQCEETLGKHSLLAARMRISSLSSSRA